MMNVPVWAVINYAREEIPGTVLEGYINDMAEEMRRLRDALESCLKNDKTKYQHHEPRPFDGLTPDAVGATIWKTPNEIAGSALFDPPKQTSVSNPERKEP